MHKDSVDIPGGGCVDDENQNEMETLRNVDLRLSTISSANISERERNSARIGSAVDVLSNVEEDSDVDEVDGNNNNTFAVKKTHVQGMMDVALITANANQLRYIIEFSSNSATYSFLFTMILISILLQLVVGISLILIGKRSFHVHIEDNHAQHPYAELCNKFVLIAVFLIMIINVLIASFPITSPSNQ